MGTTKIQKRGPDTNQITGQMNFADLFNTGFGLTTDEKIIKYLFDTREFCDYCGWFNDLKNAYLSGKDLVEESQKMFATVLNGRMLFLKHIPTWIFQNWTGAGLG